MTPERLVDFLRDPAVYPEPTREVELLQTHISYLFLTDHHVYKVKKPVDFGFLDYSTLAKRRHFCEREISLNSRLCPDVYLGVVEIREQEGRLSLDGPGETVEYAVKMTRLPADRMLREVLGRGEGEPGILRRIARTLAEFHQRAESSPEIQAMKGLDGVTFNCEENFEQTAGYVGALLSPSTYEYTQTATRLFLRRRARLFQERARAGRVRDGHGDVHLDSVCVTEPIRIFDCIEFNQRFRYQDVAEEVAFLAMDLEFEGFEELARVFVQAYTDASSDAELSELLDFYRAYRAYVRAKVTSFATDDPHIPADTRERMAATARRYYELAERYARRFNPQRLLLMCGVTGTGKSTVARTLGERFALQVVRSDVVRKELLGIDPHERRHVPFGEGEYDSAITARTYASMAERAAALLEQGHSVILDGCYIEREQRRPPRELAERMGVPYLVLECQAPGELVRKRLERRVRKDRTISDGRLEIYEGQLKAFEPTDEIGATSLVVLDRSHPVEEHLAMLKDRLPPEWGEGVPPVRPGDRGPGTGSRG